MRPIAYTEGMTKHQKLWAASGHLSYLLGLPMVLPLILYVWKRDSDAFVADQAKQAAGMHLIATLVCILGSIFAFGTFGIGMILVVPALMVFLGLTMIFSVIAVVKVADGESYHYPVFGNWLARL